MTDIRDKGDQNNMANNNNAHKSKGKEGASPQITGLGHKSNKVKVELSGNSFHFNGDVYLMCGRKELKHETIKRYQRKERQREKETTTLTEEERESRREKHHLEWQERKVRQKQENESRWEERNAKEGRILSKEEQMERDQMESKQLEDRQKNRRLTAYFKPAEQNVASNAMQSAEAPVNVTSGADETCEDIIMIESIREEAINEENRTDQEATFFKQGMDVFLHLAFIDHEQVDCMLVKDAQKYIKKKGIIGKVTIQEMIGRNIAKLDLQEFGKLYDYDRRDAGRDVDKRNFSKLKEALHGLEGKVNTKYLTKQNRQCGTNHKWTAEEVEEIRKAVERAKQKWPTRCFAKAAETLRLRYKGSSFGSITKDQVRNVYRLKVEKIHAPTAPVGRPKTLSTECIEALKSFTARAVNNKYSRPVSYYMHHYIRIIKEHNEAKTFAERCGNPRKYLRKFIRSARGSRRKATKQGARRLSVLERKTYTDTIVLRLAYLVKRHNLRKEDVFNFDETALRYHEDSDGMLIAPIGAKHVERNPSDSTICLKQCLTFIPMVSCAGDKLDPAMIFKGTAGRTSAIPGHEDGFTKWNELYNEGKICFMQNQGKWTTNQTMKEWFTGYIIPRIQEAKQKRRDAGQEVSPKYVIILDGVSTHCLRDRENEESWITTVQREDKDLILLWLPPNTTGDLQPLDVNFNRPLKVKYRDELYKIKLLSGEEDDKHEDEVQEHNNVEESTVIGDDGNLYHLDIGIQRDTRSRTKGKRQEGSAFKVKSRVIEAIINSYKSITKECIQTAWRISGKAVIEEFHKGTFQNSSQLWSGYNGAWTEGKQNTAIRAQEDITMGKKLFFAGMSGGISDLELGLHFVPAAGKPSNQPAQEASQQDIVMEEAQTTACSMEVSEYASKDCPDQDGVSDEDDSDEEEIVEGFDELAIEETDQTSP